MPKNTTQAIPVICRQIGLRIRVARRNLGYTQEQLAERLDLSSNFIAHLERGSRKPSLDTLIALSGMLEVPLEGLVKADTAPASAPKEHPLVRRAYRLLKETPKDRLKLLVQVMEEMESQVGIEGPRKGRRRQ
jgi:transcriptional regulator with XRE-family HTH domain